MSSGDTEVGEIWGDDLEAARANKGRQAEVPEILLPVVRIPGSLKSPELQLASSSPSGAHSRSFLRNSRCFQPWECRSHNRERGPKGGKACWKCQAGRTDESMIACYGEF